MSPPDTACPYRVRQRHPARTRLQFTELRGRPAHCALVARGLRAMAGVRHAEARPTTGSVILEHPDAPIALAQVIALVTTTSQVIIAPLPPEQDPLRPVSAAVGCCPRPQEDGRKTHVSGLTLLLSSVYILYLFVRGIFVSTTAAAGSLLGRILTLPALVALGLSLPIQRQALDNLRQTGRPDMGLISTGLLYLSILTGNVLAALVVFWLFNLSSWLEDRIRTRTRQAVREMLGGRGQTAWLLHDNLEIEVDAASLQAGDIISLRLGNAVPADGRVIHGCALVNEAALTGESLPVTKLPGALVLAGTTVIEGEIQVRVERAGEETRLAAIIRLIENAENDPGEIQRTSLRLSQTLVPFSLGLAVLAFLLTGSLLQAMAVLIITCPCALRLSTSVAVSSAMSNAAGRGILIKGGRYVEIAGRIDVLVLDKTGTLTGTVAEVTQVQVLDRRFGGNTVLRLAASAQKSWPHPLSRAVTRRVEQLGLPLLPCTKKTLLPGRGIEAMIGGKPLLSGSRSLMEERGIDVEGRMRRHGAADLPGNSAIYVARAGRLIGHITVSHHSRGDVAGALQRLRQLGIRHVALLSGDHEAGVRPLLEQCDFDEVRWTQTPEDKAAWINTRRREHPGELIAMVGDGINDTPAFAAADLSMAIGEGGAEVTVEYADIVLQPGGLDQVADTLAIGRRTLTVIKQCHALAIGANATILLLTTLGLLSPVAGALLHNLVTVAAVTNAAKIRKYPPTSASATVSPPPLPPGGAKSAGNP